jgi:hypothetical protein
LIGFYYSPAQSGSLNSTFNGNGVLMTSTGYNAGTIAVQPDGKVIVGKGYLIVISSSSRLAGSRLMVPQTAALVLTAMYQEI